MRRLVRHRIPKQIFFGQLATGKRQQCGPVRRFKDVIKSHMKWCEINAADLCSASLNRTSWRTLCHKAAILSLRTRVSQLSSIDEQSGSSAHNHSTTLVPGRAAAAPGSATPELDSTHHMNGLTDDKKRSVVPTAQSSVCATPLHLVRPDHAKGAHPKRPQTKTATKRPQSDTKTTFT